VIPDRPESYAAAAISVSASVPAASIITVANVLCAIVHAARDAALELEHVVELAAQRPAPRRQGEALVGGQWLRSTLKSPVGHAAREACDTPRRRAETAEGQSELHAPRPQRRRRIRRRVIGFGLALILLIAVPGVALADLATTTFDSVRIDRSSQELVIIGTISCTQTETTTISAFVTQRTLEAGASTDVACGTTPVPWEILLPLWTSPFRPGSAVLDIGLSAGSTVTGQSVEITILLM
jgi:hypothetical protein